MIELVPLLLTDDLTVCTGVRVPHGQVAFDGSACPVCELVFQRDSILGHVRELAIGGVVWGEERPCASEAAWYLLERMEEDPSCGDI